LLETIERILIHWPRYGYRRVTAQLKREGCEVGETRVRRLLKKLDHSASVGYVRVRTTDSRHTERRFPNLIKELKVVASNQVWVADITYIRLGRRFIYLAVILDAFTRGLRGWHLGRSLEARDLTERALEMALAHHPAPGIHHSDQGKRYAASTYPKLLPDTSRVSMAASGQPTENAIAERFIRTLKEEHVDYSDYRDFDDACEQLANWLEVKYMTERIHMSLNYLTPAEFESVHFVDQTDTLLAEA
jgi:putative transposase